MNRMRAGETPRPSWICRDESERARFLDLHARLLGANTRILLSVVVVLGAALPFLENPAGLVPAVAGVALFGTIQRNAHRFSRPEVWVFPALLGAELMIVLALAQTDSLTSPAMVLLCWPVAGLAGRFANRVSWIGTAYTMVIAAAAALVTEPGILSRDPVGCPCSWSRWGPSTRS
jgi:hypothetical protein